MVEIIIQNPYLVFQHFSYTSPELAQKLTAAHKIHKILHFTVTVSKSPSFRKSSHRQSLAPILGAEELWSSECGVCVGTLTHAESAQRFIRDWTTEQRGCLAGLVLLVRRWFVRSSSLRWRPSRDGTKDYCRPTFLFSPQRVIAVRAPRILLLLHRPWTARERTNGLCRRTKGGQSCFSEFGCNPEKFLVQYLLSRYSLFNCIPIMLDVGKNIIFGFYRHCVCHFTEDAILIPALA